MLVRLQTVPFAGRLDQMEDVILIIRLAGQFVVGARLNREIAFHREVYDRGRDATQGDCIVQQGRRIRQE